MAGSQAVITILLSPISGLLSFTCTSASTVFNWSVSHCCVQGLLTDFQTYVDTVLSLEINPTVISDHKLKPLVSSTPKKSTTTCLDLCDSDSSFSSEKTESLSRCWIDLNDSNTSEQNNLSLMQSWKSHV